MDHLSRAFAPLTWLVDIIPAPVYLPDGFPGTSFKATARQWKATNEAAMEIPYSFVRRQMSKGHYRPSYVSNLLERSIANNAFAKDANLARDDEEAIKWTAVSLYAAGSDSTVSILTSFVLAMVMFPEVQRKAQDEIDRVVGSDRLPGFQDRENLPYISGIVKEAWRWNPVGPMGLAHMAEEDIIYNDYLIPKGAYLLPSLWWFLHDPVDYSEPDHYKPERYMEPLNEPDPSEVAFGYGRRSCSGRYFADSSVFITIAQTLATFQIGKARDAQGNEIEARLEAVPGMVNRPKEFSFKVAPRSVHHAELLRRIGAEHPFEEGDSSLLDMSTAQ
jgi:cytochrome P450